MMRLMVLFLLVSFCAFAKEKEEEHTVPNSYYKVEDINNKLSIPGDRRWFVGANLMRDLPQKNEVNGVGVRIGYLFNQLYIDISAASYTTAYSGIRVYQKGVVREVPFEDGTEIGRARNDGDPGSLYLIGPTVGFMSKLFKSNHWVEMGSFNLAFTRYNDSKREIIFHGGTASMHGAIGYRFGPSVVSVGATWHQGYIVRVNSTKVRADGDERKNYLPIQWWTADAELKLFVF